jgi:uncharacterized damage-inducible protein DinB
MSLVASIDAEYRRYKALGEAAIAQLADEALCAPGPNTTNSIAILVWHVAGNLESRFTDFRTSDGEKAWRHRDDEFIARTESRVELFEKWDRGWNAVLAAIGSLTDGDLSGTVTIRQQPLPIDQALLRSLAHTVYHVGQIVYLAKALAGTEWRWLSIPPGGSEAYNQQPVHETAQAHTARLTNT